MSERPDASWPVSWSAVKEMQLNTWLRATPAQRLAWMEEMLELARLASASRRQASQDGKKK